VKCAGKDHILFKKCKDNKIIMWLLKLRLKHDCVIGNRCEKFKITTTGMPFNVYIEKGTAYSPQIQTLQGNEKDISTFIIDLKKDPKISNLEREGNTVFFIEKRTDKIPATFYNPKLLFFKPVFVDTTGYEHWELTSWNKSILTDFINNLKQSINLIEIKGIQQIKLKDIYYPHLLPELTENQKRAIELAISQGFYMWPKKTSLGKLAKQMKISVPTYREHLKKAEEKIVPNLTNSLK